MKIALVSQEYPPETAKGGIGTQTYLKAHGLAARGHEVWVISQTAAKSLQRSQDGPVRVIRTPGYYQRMRIFTEPAGWLAYSAEIAAVLAELRDEVALDLVEFPEWGGEGYVHLLNQTEWNHVPAIIQIHGPMVMFGHALGWPELDSEFYRIATEMEGTCLRLADGIFSSSQCSADWCCKHYQLGTRQIPVMHTGVDISEFFPRDLPKNDRPTVIFAGRLTANKGVETLLKACIGVRKHLPDLCLIIAGAGDPDLEQRLRRDAPPGLVEMMGFVSHRDLPEVLSRAHVFAAPSVYEGGPGFVYLEAMACGLPPIGCSGSGVAEVIEDGVTGFLVPPNDPEKIEEVLLGVLNDPRKAAEMGAAARAYVCRHAEREQCLDAIDAYYRRVAGAQEKHENHDSGTR